MPEEVTPIHVRILERKVIVLENEIHDLKYRLISNERKAAEEKRRKLGNVLTLLCAITSEA